MELAVPRKGFVNFGIAVCVQWDRWIVYIVSLRADPDPFHDYNIREAAQKGIFFLLIFTHFFLPLMFALKELSLVFGFSYKIEIKFIKKVILFFSDRDFTPSPLPLVVRSLRKDFFAAALISCEDCESKIFCKPDTYD